MYLDNIDSPKRLRVGIRKSLVFQDSPFDIDKNPKANTQGPKTIFQ